MGDLCAWTVNIIILFLFICTFLYVVCFRYHLVSKRCVCGCNPTKMVIYETYGTAYLVSDNS